VIFWRFDAHAVSLDFKSRSRERAVLRDLLERNVGNGLCHAWYTRRFLESVTVSESKMPHAGLGLQAYVQWSSPIRRFSDLQVHACVKRYLRRQKVYQLVRSGLPIPENITAHDLGVPPGALACGRFAREDITAADLDNDIDYMEGIGLIAVGKRLQRQSQQYWLFEHIRRRKEADTGITFKATVLGCVDPEKGQFAIFVEELGLEHRFTSPGGRLEPGTVLPVKVDTVSPRSGLLSFVAVV
jgi:exoribonuclease R